MIWLIVFNLKNYTLEIYPPSLGLASLASYLSERNIIAKKRSVVLPITEDCGKSVSPQTRENPQIFFDFINNVEDFRNRNDVYGDWFKVSTFIQLWAKAVSKDKPEAVGISIYRENLFVSLLFARFLRKVCPDTKIIFGGPECYELNGQCFVREGFADIAIIGEGEEVLYQILHQINKKKLTGFKGAIIKKDNTVFFEGHSETHLNINALPVPDFKGLISANKKPDTLPVAFNRGCVFSCKFCTETLYWRSYRQMNVSRCIELLLTLKKRHDINKFFLNQSLVNGNLKWLKELALAIDEEQLGISWGGNARIHPKMDDNYMRVLYKGGCRFLHFGIESTSQTVLKSMNKGTCLKTILSNLNMSTTNGIWTHTYWIIGYPTETREDLLDTLRFILKNYRIMDSYYFHLYKELNIEYALNDNPVTIHEYYCSLQSINKTNKSAYVQKHVNFLRKCIILLNTVQGKSYKFNRPMDIQKKRVNDAPFLAAIHLVKFYIEEPESNIILQNIFCKEHFLTAFESFSKNHKIENLGGPHVDQGIGKQIFHLIKKLQR